MLLHKVISLYFNQNIYSFQNNVYNELLYCNCHLTKKDLFTKDLKFCQNLSPIFLISLNILPPYIFAYNMIYGIYLIYTLLTIFNKKKEKKKILFKSIIHEKNFLIKKI